MGDMPEFAVEVLDPDSRCPVAVVRGEIDLATVPQMVQCLESIVTMAPDALVFDFGEVSFFGATGIGALVSIRNALPSRSRIIVRRPRPIVGLVLTITEMESLCSIEE
jgi:anti-sigma B factor antagonist